MALSMAAADKRNMMGGSLSEASLKEYLEDQQDEIKPPAKNSSPLQICILISPLTNTHTESL